MVTIQMWLPRRVFRLTKRKERFQLRSRLMHVDEHF